MCGPGFVLTGRVVDPVTPVSFFHGDAPVRAAAGDGADAFREFEAGQVRTEAVSALVLAGCATTVDGTAMKAGTGGSRGESRRSAG